MKDGDALQGLDMSRREASVRGTPNRTSGSYGGAKELVRQYLRPLRRGPDQLEAHDLRPIQPVGVRGAAVVPRDQWGTFAGNMNYRARARVRLSGRQGGLRMRRTGGDPRRSSGRDPRTTRAVRRGRVGAEAQVSGFSRQARGRHQPRGRIRAGVLLHVQVAVEGAAGTMNRTWPSPPSSPRSSSAALANGARDRRRRGGSPPSAGRPRSRDSAAAPPPPTDPTRLLSTRWRAGSMAVRRHGRGDGAIPVGLGGRSARAAPRLTLRAPR